MQHFSSQSAFVSYEPRSHQSLSYSSTSTPIHSISGEDLSAGGGTPISHPAQPDIRHQSSFDTFDDIEWTWTPPTTMEPHQSSEHVHHGMYAHYGSAPGQTPGSPFGARASDSPHSPSLHENHNQHGLYTSNGVGTPSDGTGSFVPLSGPSSFSTSPPPISSMAPPSHGVPYITHHHHQPLMLSTSLPVNMGMDDYRGTNGGPHSFVFPSTSTSPPAQNHHMPHSPPFASPLSASDWSPNSDSLQQTSNAGRPIRRRTSRKSESDTSYTSPAAAAARLHLQRSMSSNQTGNRPTSPDSNPMMFLPSPSSPLARTPPTLVTYLPSANVAGAGGAAMVKTKAMKAKHRRSASSGGSSSSPGGGLLLSASPASPRDGSRQISTSANEELVEDVKEKEEEYILEVEPDTRKRRKRSSVEVPISSNGMTNSNKAQEAVLRKSALQPPKASPSTWQIYFTDQLQLYRTRYPDQKLNVAQAAKELAQEYKRLTPEQSEPYKRRAMAAKAERDKEMAAWSRTLTPGDVRLENAFRTAQRKDGKSRKANMKDPNAPKKPLSAYFMFLQRIRADDDMVREVFGEETGTTKQSVLAAAKWRSMSDDEKKPFLARAEQEKLLYEQARRAYEESFVDPDDPDSGASYLTSVPFLSGTGTLVQQQGGDGYTLSGHLVGIQQLSLDDTFILNAPLPNIKAFKVPGKKAHQLEPPTEEEIHEAMQESFRQRIPN